MVGFDRLALRTERLLLRPLQAADAPALFSIHSDVRVMRHWSRPPWASTQQASAYIERDIAAVHAGDCLRLGIERAGLLRKRWIVGCNVSDRALYGLLARDWQRKVRPGAERPPQSARG